MNKYRILVVEDEALIAASLVHALSSLGYTVLEPVATGEDAIRAVQTEKPHLVLMDIVLIGEMDGIVAAEKIRAIADIPIVYLTAYTDDLRLKQARITEPYGYIVKPAFTRELNATIEMAMYKHALDRKLRESEEHYRTVVEDQTELITRFSPDGTLTFVNEVYCRFFGKPMNEVIGTRWQPNAVPEDVAEIETHLKALSPSNPVTVIENRVYNGEGEIRWMQFVNRGFFDENGRLTKIQAVGRDITERRQVEEALRESEANYRRIVETANEGIWSMSETYTTLYVNRKMADMLGYAVEEMIGKKVSYFFYPGDLPDHDRQMERRVQGQDAIYERRFRHRDGSDRWMLISATVQKGAQGEFKGSFAMLTDITKRKRAEEQLKNFNKELESQVRLRTIELERLNTLLEAEVIQRTLAEDRIRKSLNERGLLLREVHHRVRNNLQIILSLIRLQSRNIKDQKLLETMGEFQNRIMAMVHVHERMYHAEDFSRIDLSEICTHLTTSLFKSYKVDPQHIRLNVEMKDLQITLDSAIPISLILNELISNSIKHAFPKGTKGEITVAGRREADTLVLSIKDTGIGIPKDLDWMRNKQSLGHRLVVSLVEQLNGTIELDRTTGTAFNIVVKEKP